MTDAGADEWLLDDELLQLREWGTDRVHALPARDAIAKLDITIGAAYGCTLRLTDPTGQVSREHALLRFGDGRWHVTDRGSKNGVRLDGARRLGFPLSPGVELGLGGITLIAESARSIELRDFLARLLGWSAARLGAVDLALRAVRAAATRRAALVVCGDGDLVPVARGLHSRALGDDKPFVVCDPRRRRTEATVRSAASRPRGLAALDAATGGTMCVAASRLPRDFPQLALALRDPASRVQLAVCAAGVAAPRPLPGDPIALPALCDRAGELERIIDEYAADAIAALRTSSASFTARDRDWVRRHAAASLAEIEKATRRLVAIREHGTIMRAAHHLGMSHVALSRWLTRRRRRG